MNLQRWSARARVCAVSVCCAVAALAAQAHSEAAPVSAEGAWARASVPGQQASGAFVRLTAREPLKLVGVESPVAAIAEVHEMKMEGDVMRMRAVQALDLPAGVPVDLKPGGYHLMLQRLKAPLAKDTEVPITLVFRNARGEVSRLPLQVPVRTSAPGAVPVPAAAPQHGAHGH